MLGPPLRSTLLGAALWLALGFAGGYAALARLGDYGSILQLLTGLVIGALGAIAHMGVCAHAKSRPLGFLRRGLLTWLLAYLPFLAGSLFLLNPARAAQWDPHAWQTLFMYLVPYTGLPMLLLAVLVALVTSARERAGGAGPGKR